jgi:hypothetical protein
VGEEVVSVATVGVSDLAGHARVLGNLGEGTYFTDDFDFDGHRIAWWSYGCTKALIRVVSATGTPRLNPPRKGCALRFNRAPTRSSRQLTLHVNCFGFAFSECRARNVVITTKGTHHRVVARGHTGAHVRLTAAGQRLLRSHRRLHVRVRATLTDEVGRREVRVGTLTLRSS